MLSISVPPSKSLFATMTYFDNTPPYLSRRLPLIKAHSSPRRLFHVSKHGSQGVSLYLTYLRTRVPLSFAAPFLFARRITAVK